MILNTSSILSNISPFNHIAISQYFYQTLLHEFILIDNKFFNKSDYEFYSESLKGIGLTDYILINNTTLKKISNMIYLKGSI